MIGGVEEVVQMFDRLPANAVLPASDPERAKAWLEQTSAWSRLITRFGQHSSNGVVSW